MNFQYIGSSADNKVVKGDLAAANKEIAEKILANRGYKIFSLKPVASFMPSREQAFSSYTKVKPQVIIVFSRQLALLLESGNDIVTSLRLLQTQSSHPYFKKILGEVITELNTGSTLALGLSKHPDIFSKIYTQTVGVGEQSGNLESILRQVADYMDRDAKVVKQLKGALKYPMIVIVVAFIVVGVLAKFVLPAFTDLYSSMGTQLPFLAQLMLSSMKWLSANALYLMGTVIGLVFVGYVYTRTPNGRLVKDKAILRLPLLGPCTHLNELVRCCRTMSILYKSGMPVTEIMALAIENSNNLVIKDALTQVQHGVITGGGLSASMSRNESFLPMMVQMVGVGEASGNLDVTLMATADNYETEAEDKMHAIIAYIQPVITLGIGIFVAIIALTMVSAMYSVYGSMG